MDKQTIHTQTLVTGSVFQFQFAQIVDDDHWRFSMAVFNLVEDVVPVIHFDHLLDHVFIRVDSSQWTVFANRFQIARVELPLIELLDVGAAETREGPVTKLDLCHRRN